MKNLTIKRLNKFHMAFLVFFAFWTRNVTASDNIKQVKDDIDALYNASLSFPLTELTQLKTNKNKHIWSIASVLEICEHLNLALTEVEVNLLHEFSREVADTDVYEGEYYKRLFTVFTEKLDGYIDLQKLNGLGLNKEHILSDEISGEAITLIVASKLPRNLTLDGNICKSNSVQTYICNLQGISNLASVSVVPLSAEVKLKLSFFKTVLSKLLGGNETLLNIDYPFYVIPSQIGTVTLLGSEQVTEKSKKTFSFPVSYRNPHCRRTSSKIFTYNIPDNYSVIGRPVFEGKVDGFTTITKVGDNEISLKATLKNIGECLSILGSKVSSDVQGSISGTVIVHASTSEVTSKPITLLNTPIAWGEEVFLQLDGNAFSSGLILVNDTNAIDIFDSKFLEVTRSENSVLVKAKSIEQFLAANAL